MKLKNLFGVALMAGAGAGAQEPAAGVTYWYNGANNGLLNAAKAWVTDNDASKVVAEPDLTSGANTLRITKSDVQNATMPADVSYSVKGIVWVRGWGNFTVAAGSNSRIDVGEGGVNTDQNANGSRVFTIKGQVGVSADQVWKTNYELHDVVFSGGVQGTGAVEKTGPGRAIVGGATGVGTGNNVYDWPKTTLSGGTFQTDSANVFSAGHEIVFNGSEASPATFDLKTFNQIFENAAWREGDGGLDYNTLTTSGAASKFNVVFTGEPAFNPTGFGGKMSGGVGVTWDPSDAGAVFAITNGASDTQGNFYVRNGTMRVDGGASLLSPALISVAGGARFEMASGAGTVAGTSLDVASGGKVVVAAGKQMVFDQVSYAGGKLGGGRYTAANAAWVEGDGTVVAAGNIWTAGGAADTVVDNSANWGGAQVDLSGGTLTAIFASAGDTAVIPGGFTAVLRGILFDGLGGFEVASEDGGSLTLGVQGIQTVSGASAKRWSVTAPVTLSANQYWSANGSDVLVVSNKVSGSANLTKDGNGVLQMWGDNDFSGDLNVVKGELHAYSDNAFGSTAGKTTILSGAGTVVLQGCSTPENFVFSNGGGNCLKGAANKISHVYGRIDNKSTGANFTLKADGGGELHLHGGVYGNGNFGFDRLYVHDVPLHITDRFSSTGSIYLNVASNWVGNNHTLISSGCRIYCRVPYAYYRGPRSETGAYGSIGKTLGNTTYVSRMQFNSTGTGIFDLGGFDQETCQVYCKEANSAKSCVTSSVPAQLHIYCDSDNGHSATSDMARNYVKFTGGAGCTIDRFGKYALTFFSLSTTTGRLVIAEQVAPTAAASTLTLGTSAGAGGWPFASEVRVTSGRLVLTHGACLGDATDVYVDPAKGVLQLDNATVQNCRYLFVYDAGQGRYVRQICGRTYGGADSSAAARLSGFAGSGLIKPLGTSSGFVMVIR